MKTMTGVIALMFALMFSASSIVVAAEKPPVQAPMPGYLKITGKVTAVNPATRTFTVAAGGQSRTFSGARLTTLPAVGAVVDVEYTETGGGRPAEAANLNLSKSNVN